MSTSGLFGPNGRDVRFGEAPICHLKFHDRKRIVDYVVRLNEAQRTPRQHWGPITPAFERVLKVLLEIGNGSGQRFPSYAYIAKAARCARSTVHLAINALERAGVITWVNRLCRKVVPVPGSRRHERKLSRDSNGYIFLPLPEVPPGRPPAKEGWSESRTVPPQKESSLAQPATSHFEPCDPADAQQALAEVVHHLTLKRMAEQSAKEALRCACRRHRAEDRGQELGNVS